MIHEGSRAGDEFERAIAAAHPRVTIVDLIGLFVTLYLTLCIFSAVAR